MSDNDTKSVDRALLEKRTSDAAEGLSGSYGKTFAEAEVDREARYNDMLTVLNEFPGLSLEAWAICDRLIKGGMSITDAAEEAARSVDPNEF